MRITLDMLLCYIFTLHFLCCMNLRFLYSTVTVYLNMYTKKNKHSIRMRIVLTEVGLDKILHRGFLLNAVAATATMRSWGLLFFSSDLQAGADDPQCPRRPKLGQKSELDSGPQIHENLCKKSTKGFCKKCANCWYSISSYIILYCWTPSRQYSFIV